MRKSLRTGNVAQPYHAAIGYQSRKHLLVDDLRLYFQPSDQPGSQPAGVSIGIDAEIPAVSGQAHTALKSLSRDDSLPSAPSRDAMTSLLYWRVTKAIPLPTLLVNCLSRVGQDD